MLMGVKNPESFAVLPQQALQHEPEPCSILPAPLPASGSKRSAAGGKHLLSSLGASAGRGGGRISGAEEGLPELQINVCH